MKGRGDETHLHVEVRGLRRLLEGRPLLHRRKGRLEAGKDRVLQRVQAPVGLERHAHPLEEGEDHDLWGVWDPGIMGESTRIRAYLSCLYTQPALLSPFPPLIHPTLPLPHLCERECRAEEEGALRVVLRVNGLECQHLDQNHLCSMAFLEAYDRGKREPPLSHLLRQLDVKGRLGLEACEWGVCEAGVVRVGSLVVWWCHMDTHQHEGNPSPVSRALTSGRAGEWCAR